MEKVRVGFGPGPATLKNFHNALTKAATAIIASFLTHSELNKGFIAA